jgi:hypothetical protein
MSFNVDRLHNMALKTDGRCHPIDLRSPERPISPQYVKCARNSAGVGTVARGRRYVRLGAGRPLTMKGTLARQPFAFSEPKGVSSAHS